MPYALPHWYLPTATVEDQTPIEVAEDIVISPKPPAIVVNVEDSDDDEDIGEDLLICEPAPHKHRTALFVQCFVDLFDPNARVKPMIQVLH